MAETAKDRRKGKEKKRAREGGRNGSSLSEIESRQTRGRDRSSLAEKKRRQKGRMSKREMASTVARESVMEGGKREFERRIKRE